MAKHLDVAENLLLLEQRSEIPQPIGRHSIIKKLHFIHVRQPSKIFLLTAKDRTNDLRRSPTSAFVSCPNCTRAPRNRLIFNSRWLSCADDEFANNAETEDGVTVGGGVPLAVGDELLCRFTLELLVFDAGIIVFMG